MPLLMVRGCFRSLDEGLVVSQLTRPAASALPLTKAKRPALVQSEPQGASRGLLGVMTLAACAF